MKALAQNRCGQFCHFGICGPNWDRHHANWYEDQAGVEIYYWEHPKFWLIWSSQNDPILGPQFPPSVWSIGGPISLSPQGARTQLQVVHSDMDFGSCFLPCELMALPWPGEPRVGTRPILVIFAS